MNTYHKPPPLHFSVIKFLLSNERSTSQRLRKMRNRSKRVTGRMRQSREARAEALDVRKGRITGLSSDYLASSSCALPGAEMWICSLHKQPRGRAEMVSCAYLCGCAIKKEKPGEDGLMADSCAIYFCFTFNVLVRNS